MIEESAINLPQVLDEVRAACARYERAFVSNDLDALDELFWESALVVRFGRGENLYGIEAIRAFRAARDAGELRRTLANTVITTFGHDVATANTEFYGANSTLTGRQSQTWLRLDGGWRIVSAHVSLTRIVK